MRSETSPHPPQDLRVSVTYRLRRAHVDEAAVHRFALLLARPKARAADVEVVHERNLRKARISKLFLHASLHYQLLPGFQF